MWVGKLTKSLVLNRYNLHNVAVITMYPLKAQAHVLHVDVPSALFSHKGFSASPFLEGEFYFSNW